MLRELESGADGIKFYLEFVTQAVGKFFEVMVSKNRSNSRNNGGSASFQYLVIHRIILLAKIPIALKSQYQHPGNEAYVLDQFPIVSLRFIEGHHRMGSINNKASYLLPRLLETR